MLRRHRLVARAHKLAITSLSSTRLLTFALGIPSAFAVTAADWPPLTRRTASSLNSSVHLPRTYFAIISRSLPLILTISY